MNVVRGRGRARARGRAAPRERPRAGLLRRGLGTALGILGTTSVYSMQSNSARPVSATPRYQFNNEPVMSNSKKSSMGPPTGPVRSLKRKNPVQSSSTRAESSSSGPPGARVLANDSMLDTSRDMHTPRNRPTALRYISSSSKGRSHPHSARSTTTSTAEASIILAIAEGRGMARGEIGLAAVDLRHPHLVLCQFSDSLLYTHTLTKINFFNPVEIIVPHTFCEGVQPTQLYRLIRDQYPGVTLTTVQRRHFNDTQGLQQIQTLCAPAYRAVCMQLLHKFYALTAAAAVLKYVEYIQCVVFVRESLKIDYHCSENTMLIDVGTATQLELVQPLELSAGPKCCLLGVLGPTYTVGGIRALRAEILQPPYNRELIENRLDCVQELIDNDEGLMVGLQDVIKKLVDVEKILFLCMESPKQEMNKMSEAQLNQTLLLKTTMDLVPKLVEALGIAQSGRLRKIKIDLENPQYTEIAERIHKVIQQDAHMEKGTFGNLQRCFAVKPEINGLLDVARRTYSELIDDIQKIVEQLSEMYDMPIRLNQNVLKGFHIVLPLAPRNRRMFKIEDLPDIFIQVQNNGASVSMTTEELVVLDQQAKESLNEIHSMSNIVIYGLLKELRPFMGSLYKLCENVADLDILLALAQASSIGSYVRPEFNQYLEIRNSVHPLLDYNTPMSLVPNDIQASPEYNFTIITGPNMGGKSIYIKQVAILQIMAQIGCFLPATNAVLRLSDKLFSRIGFNDSIELNASTYVLEMKEIQHILKDMTPTSLVIIDELCRGTCSEEGGSMVWAICEELMKTQAYTFITTHFIYLTRLQELYLNVINLHTVVGEERKTNTTDQRRLVYHHKIEPGITQVEHYGLALAKNTNLPEMTIKLAEELAELIAETKKPFDAPRPAKTDEILLYKLNADIKKEMRKSINSEAAVKALIENFKKDNSHIIQRLISVDSNNEISANSAPGSTKSSITPTNNVNEEVIAINNSSPKGDGQRKITTVHRYVSSTFDDLQAELIELPSDSEIRTELQNLLDKSNNNFDEPNVFSAKNTTQLLNTVIEDHGSYDEYCDEIHKINECFDLDESDLNLNEDSIHDMNEIELSGIYKPHAEPNECFSINTDNISENMAVPESQHSYINNRSLCYSVDEAFDQQYFIEDHDEEFTNNTQVLNTKTLRKNIESDIQQWPKVSRDMNVNKTQQRNENNDFISEDISVRPMATLSIKTSHKSVLSDIAIQPTQILDIGINASQFSRRIDINDDSFANHSTQISNYISPRSISMSQSTISSIDEDLMIECVTEIHNEIESTDMNNDYNELQSTKEINNGMESTVQTSNENDSNIIFNEKVSTEQIYDLILPPPPGF